MSDSARSLEIARRMVELGRTKDAVRAYTLALEAGIENDPEAELEAAICVLQFGKDYRIPYKVFHSLHRRGLFRENVYGIMTGAFYEPNVKDLRSRYERNCKRLSKYPYFFRRDFMPFEDLPIIFYPYDDSSYIPYYPAEDRFGDLIDFKEPVIKHYFFKDLENPILAENIFSQYELEYLNDNVRKSEYVAKENHVYLHYTDWAVFCAYLQCWNLNSLLDDEKFVFLMEDEIAQYPIDFKARFGIDYSQYQVKPIGIREVNRLIWHTQLFAHNGGDFFNEIFDAHPNLIVMPSIMMSNVAEVMANMEKFMEGLGSNREAASVRNWSQYYMEELYLLKGRTAKDLLVAYYLNSEEATAGLDHNSRIAPALFFQPHFSYIHHRANVNAKRQAVPLVKEYEEIRKSPIFRFFKYTKAFTPMRRITTSYGATVKFMLKIAKEHFDAENDSYYVVTNLLYDFIVNRSYMADPEERLFKDSILVRFEDGKLNPKATFTALAAFLDLPYTESMTYCSEFGSRDFHTEGNVDGFDPATVYRTYDEYANDAERTLVEYFCRDVYQKYGYDFHYYNGEEMTLEHLLELNDGCTTLGGCICQAAEPIFRRESLKNQPDLSEEERDALVKKKVQARLEDTIQERKELFEILQGGLRFVNPSGQPLRFMPQLELDPALLEQPLYH